MVGFATNSRSIHESMERTDQFIGQSLAFLDAVERASRAAPLNRPVLVIGERGTGKELIAERLHHLSSRWAGPLIIMNCAALPENLIEAELFGHEAGQLYRRRQDPPRALRGSRRRHLVPRRARHLVDAGAGPAAARHRIWRDHAHRRVEADHGRRPHRRGDQRESAGAGRQGEVPRRPARPPVVRGHHLAAAPRASGRHPVARRAFRAAHGGRARLAQLAGLQPARHGRSSRPITGPAMSASCATSSSARSIATRIRSGRSTRSSSIPSIRPGRRRAADPCRRAPAAADAASAEETARPPQLAAPAPPPHDQRFPRRGRRL